MQIKTEEINLELLQDEYRSGIYTLNALCGIADTTLIEIATPALTLKDASTYSINPNLFLYALDSTAIEASKNLLRYNYVPRFNLFGDAGYNAIPDNPSLKKFGFSAGASLDWVIYDGGQRNLRLQQLTIQQATISSYRSYYSFQRSLQLADLDKRLKSIAFVINQWQDQLNDMNKLMTMRRQQLVAGQLSVIDYLIAMRDYRDIIRKLNDSRMQQQHIINEHNYLVW